MSTNPDELVTMPEQAIALARALPGGNHSVLGCSQRVRHILVNVHAPFLRQLCRYVETFFTMVQKTGYTPFILKQHINFDIHVLRKTFISYSCTGVCVNLCKRLMLDIIYFNYILLLLPNPSIQSMK